MSAPALAAPGGRALLIGGKPYAVVLPSVRDPRLHLTAVIVSLQVLGQVAFSFRLSIAQILIALGTCALLEVGIAAWRQHALMWPASALLTGNGVAFVLRVPGTHHGEWWSTHGWWIFAGTAAISLLSKHVIRLRGEHIFNPSNFGLVLCFLALGSTRAEPLDFWWGPMSAWMAAALAIIVVGGLVILRRLRLLRIAVAFWLAFAASVAALAVSGHGMTARWHLGRIEGFELWRILVTSPEILVFLFFMITDPKTIPRGGRTRVAYAAAIGLLATLLIAPVETEFWSKVAVLGSLAIVCLVRALWVRFAPGLQLAKQSALALSLAVLAAYGGALYAAGIPARPTAARGPRYLGPLPAIVALRSKKGVYPRQLNHKNTIQIARDVMADLRPLERGEVDQLTLQLVPGTGQAGGTPVVRIDEGAGRLRTVQLALKHDVYVIAKPRPKAPRRSRQGPVPTRHRRP